VGTIGHSSQFLSSPTPLCHPNFVTSIHIRQRISGGNISTLRRSIRNRRLYLCYLGKYVVKCGALPRYPTGGLVTELLSLRVYGDLI